jgi:hypothetical protein
MKIPEITKQRLEVIRAQILAEPERFKMSVYHWCGTTHCIAGWAQVLFPPEGVDTSGRWYAVRNIEEDAKNALQLTGLQPYNLFHCGGWPNKFADDYILAITPKQRAKVAAARITHFINTGK